MKNQIFGTSGGLAGACHSFGHAQVQADPEKDANPVKPAAAPKHAPETAASPAKPVQNPSAPMSEEDSPLARYVQSLDDPAAIPVIESKLDHGDRAFRQKIEHYAEIISKDIYSKIDPRLFQSSNLDEVKKMISDCVDAILKFNNFNLTPAEAAGVVSVLESDILGLGPLDELLANDDISDIMVDGPHEVFIEMHGRIDRSTIRFRSQDHLLNICQRIVSRAGRHVDKASPICDARLADGSRVNVILPPLSIKGPALTIRKFKKERLTLDKLVGFGTLDKKTAALLEIISASRVNTLITGGTGSGKTTLLNCLTRYIAPRERIITCEDTAELQLQQPQVLTLETRQMSTEGIGLVSMRELVRNCLRMRPDRIIVGEVRGPEAFDLLQAMNTGHEGCMGTFHANSPRDALFRLENMVAMANLNIPMTSIREQIASSLEVIVHTQRLRDGSRKVMNVTEVIGMEDEVITMQDLVSYEITGEDEKSRLQGGFKFSRLRPRFYEKAMHFGLERSLLELME
ncbi:MAG: CpaF family protein [Alphaproteobacteria bacterium]